MRTRPPICTVAILLALSWLTACERTTAAGPQYALPDQVASRTTPGSDTGAPAADAGSGLAPDRDPDGLAAETSEADDTLALLDIDAADAAAGESDTADANPLADAGADQAAATPDAAIPDTPATGPLDGAAPDTNNQDASLVDAPDTGKPDSAVVDVPPPDVQPDVPPPDVQPDVPPPDVQPDVQPDVPPVPPPWTTNPTLAVQNAHQTWQSDPSSTVTVSWTTEATDLVNYKPHLLVAPANQVGSNEAQLLSLGKVYDGLGTGYSTPIGTAPGAKVAWHVEATGLLPDTDYVARAGTWQSLDLQQGKLVAGDLSPPLHFRTAPPLGATAPMTFVLAGDSRNGLPKIQANMPYFSGINALAWFFNGDMNPTGTQDEWNAWFSAMQPILHQRPLMPVQGNHEIFAEYYYAQFALPVMPGLAAAYHEHAWSLNIGNAHFVGLDANSDTAVADQVAWLDADLQAASTNPATEWLVATMHHSAYSACKVHGSTARVQTYWVPLFEKYAVDLVFSGHDHDYERSVPILGNKVAPAGQGVQYVVVGAFFAPAYAAGSQWWTAVSESGDQGNLAILQIAGKLLTVKAYNGDGSKLIDQFSLQH